MQNFFVKSHGLGNDYIVLNQNEIQFELTGEAIKRICDVHFGIGSDGILLKVPSYKAICTSILFYYVNSGWPCPDQNH